MDNFKKLIEACESLLEFIRNRYPDDFKPGGKGFVCPHHLEIYNVLEKIKQSNKDDLLDSDDAFWKEINDKERELIQQRIEAESRLRRWPWSWWFRTETGSY